METLRVCLVTTFLFASIKPTEGCSQTEEFTIFYPKNPEAHETCKRCRKCPPGQGLAVQCGSRVPNGTFTDCKQCEVNKTYSENNDISHCKPCNLCGFKIVLQQCTPQQNSECADECIPGYKLDPIIDGCLPEIGNKISTTTTTVTTAAPSLSKRTSTRRSAGTSTPAGGIVTTRTNSSTPDPSTELPSKPANSTQIEAVADDHGESEGSSLSSSRKDQESKHAQQIKIIAGSMGAVGAVVLAVLCIVIYIAVKQRRSIRKTQSEVVVEQGEKLPLRELRAENKLARFHNDSLAGNYQNKKASGPKNDKLEVQQIPEDLRISDMLWLRDHNKQMMLFYVQEELDPIETRQKKTWRSVALFLDADTKVKDLVETCNRSMQSPTEPLIEYFKTKGDEEPGMRDFVEALVNCKRHEVAQNICNWPWEINVRGCQEQERMLLSCICHDKFVADFHGQPLHSPRQQPC